MDVASAPAALLRRANKIRDLDTLAHDIPFSIPGWKKNVRCDEVSDLIERYHDGNLNRNDLFTLGGYAIDGDDSDRRRLLFATLMWGYSKRGGRSYTNANRVLQVQSLDRTLKKCTTALRSVDLEGAFAAVAGLSGYRMGYFSKYLYFVARHIDWDSPRAKPLIFDSRVEDTLSFLHSALGYQWDEALPRRPSPVARYVHFCETAQTWARELGLAPGIAGAEKIEQYLFDPKGLRFEVDSELRKLAFAVLQDSAEGKIGPNTEAALIAMNDDLADSLRANAEF